MRAEKKKKKTQRLKTASALFSVQISYAADRQCGPASGRLCPSPVFPDQDTPAGDGDERHNTAEKDREHRVDGVSAECQEAESHE